jgi:hypothetical protein
VSQGCNRSWTGLCARESHISRQLQEAAIARDPARLTSVGRRRHTTRSTRRQGHLGSLPMYKCKRRPTRLTWPWPLLQNNGRAQPQQREPKTDVRSLLGPKGAELQLLTWNAAGLLRGSTKELALMNLLTDSGVDFAVMTKAQLPSAQFSIDGYS